MTVATRGPGSQWVMPSARDVLAHPRRYAVFEVLRASGQAVRVPDLVNQIVLHPNAIRRHLDVLVDTGLVLRERADHQGRGRPAWAYRLTPAAQERWAFENPHEELSVMLLDMLESGDAPVVVGRRAGHRLARVFSPTAANGTLAGNSPAGDSPVGQAASADSADSAPDESTDHVTVLLSVTGDLGFRPVLESDGDIRLTFCPFAATASRSRDIVCALHRGVSEGVLAAVNPSSSVDLILADPFSGRCRLVLAALPSA